MILLEDTEASEAQECMREFLDNHTGHHAMAAENPKVSMLLVYVHQIHALCYPDVARTSATLGTCNHLHHSIRSHELHITEQLLRQSGVCTRVIASHMHVCHDSYNSSRVIPDNRVIGADGRLHGGSQPGCCSVSLLHRPLQITWIVQSEKNIMHMHCTPQRRCVAYNLLCCLVAWCSY
jgi:hypothetical protein